MTYIVLKAPLNSNQPTLLLTNHTLDMDLGLNVNTVKQLYDWQHTLASEIKTSTFVLTYIHTCRSDVHTLHDFTNGSSLAQRVARALNEI